MKQHNRFSRQLSARTLGLVALAGLGCGEGGECSNPTAPCAKVVALVLSSSSLTLEPQDIMSVTATPQDKDGRARERQVSWTSTNPSVVSVSASGSGECSNPTAPCAKTSATVTGVSPGTATITASAEGLTAQLSVTVRQVVAVVAVSPSTASVQVGRVMQLNTTVIDKRNVPVPGAAVTWSSNAPTIATVSANGVVTGVGVGSATITATSEGRSGSAQVTVTLVPVATVAVAPNPGSVPRFSVLPMSATLRDDQGNVLSGRTIVWTTTNEAVATVSSTGVVTGVAQGSVTIRATSEGRQGSAAVNVTQAGVATVTVTPSPGSVRRFETLPMSAVLRDAGNNTLTNRVVTWSSSDPSVATVNTTGLVTGIAQGQTTISATSEGRIGSAVVTVTQAAVATVTVTPNPGSVVVQQTLQMSAQLRDAGNNILTGRTVTWVSSNLSRATVSTTGLVTGVAQGPVTITATSEGRQGTASVAVTPAGTTLTVTTAGAGNGSVTSNPIGISCVRSGGGQTGTCGFSYGAGSVVTLMAQPAAGGYTFQGWAGEGCGGVSTCQVTMTQARAVSATFGAPVYLLAVTTAGTGNGTITSSPSGINCTRLSGTQTGSCGFNFSAETNVLLTAQPAAGGHSFTGWAGGGCTGTGTCQVTMTQAQAVTGSFSNASALSNGIQTAPFGGALGSANYLYIDIPSGRPSLVVELRGVAGSTGDADLYVRFGSVPTLSTFDCRPYLNGNTETCTVVNPVGGRWYIMVHGFSSFAGVTVRAVF